MLLGNLKNAIILIVDDQPANIRVLERLLEQDGYTDLHSTSDSRQASGLFAELQPDLILLDLLMPYLDGFGVLEQLRPNIAMDDYLPILVLTADITPEAKRHALAAGAKDFVTKPIDAVEVLLRIRNLLEARFLHRQLQNQNQRLEEQVQARTGELQRAVVTLRAAEQKYRSLVEHLPIITYIIEYGEVNRTSYISPQVESVLGFSPAEWIADPLLWEKQMHAEDRATVLAAFELADLTIQAANLEFRLLAKDGRVVWLHGWSAPVPSEDGPPRFAHGFLEDITEDKLAKERVNYLAGLVEKVSDAIISTDTDFKIVSWNAGAVSVYGWQAEEALGQPIGILRSEYNIVSQEDLIKELLGNGFWQGELIQYHKDGRAHNIFSSVTLLRDAKGKPMGAVAVNRDVTERKQSEQQLRDSEERFSKIFQGSPVGITLTSLEEGRVIDVNEAMLKMTGHTRAEALGRTTQELGLWLDPAQREQMIRGLQTPGAVQNIDFKFVNTKGRTIEVTTAQDLIEIGGVRYILTLQQDITELKKRGRELEAIAVVSAALRKTQTRSEMLPVILDELLGLLQAKAATIILADRLSGQLVNGLGRGDWAHLKGQVIAPGEGITAQVMASGQPYSIDDSETDTRLWSGVRTKDIRALVSAPLTANEQTFGALWIGRQTPFEPAEIRLLTAVADIAASAILRAALHEQTEQQVQRLSILRQVDQAIKSSFDLELVLRVLLDQITSQLGIEAADFLSLSPNTLMLQFVAGYGFKTKAIEQSRLRLGMGVAGRAALERKAIYIPNIKTAGTEFIRAGLLAPEGFTSYYAVPAIAKGQVKGVLEFFKASEFEWNADWENFAEALADQAALAIDNAELFGNLQRSNMELALAYDATIEGWSKALDLRDKETEGHSQRVTDMSLTLARTMGLSETELLQVRRGALLHDIGKLGVPDGILLKPGKLTDEEWAIMKKHPTFAYEMLSPIDYLRPALDIPYCHHEKWDGTGYPRGLKGERIPLVARIFAVVDVWDALRSDRPYREGWPVEKVRAHIQAESGTHFDPQVVEAFLKMV